jgi:hypothetical protein
MKGLTLKAVESETFAPSTSAALDERLEPFSHDGGETSCEAGDLAKRGAALAYRLLGSRSELPGSMSVTCSTRRTSPATRPAGKTGRTIGSEHNSFAGRRITGRSKPRPRSPREWAADSPPRRRLGEVKS